jgi:hypothetical protein
MMEAGVDVPWVDPGWAPDPSWLVSFTNKIQLSSALARIFSRMEI